MPIEGLNEVEINRLAAAFLSLKSKAEVDFDKVAKLIGAKSARGAAEMHRVTMKKLVENGVIDAPSTAAAGPVNGIKKPISTPRKTIMAAKRVGDFKTLSSSKKIKRKAEIKNEPAKEDEEAASEDNDKSKHGFDQDSCNDEGEDEEY